MFKINIAAVAVASLYLLSSCVSSAEKDGLGHHHDHEHGHETEHHDDHDHEGHDDHDDHDDHKEPDGVIHLSVSQANEFGVAVETVEPSKFSEVIEVSGEIMSVPTDRSLVVAPSAGIVRLRSGIVNGKNVVAGEAIATISAKNIAGGDANENARIALESAKRELDRVTPLHEDGIVSTKEYNAVEENYRRAKAAYSGSAAGSVAKCQRGGILSELSVSDGQYVEAGQTIAVVSSNNQLTLRADVPEKYINEIPKISTANVRLSSSDDIISLSELDGKLVTGLPREVKGGYIPVYFTFENDGRILSGTFADVYLVGADRDNVLSVPVSALTEQQGEKFLFTRLDEDCYRKVAVIPGATDGQRVEIRSGLKPGDNVVVSGVTFVKLAENTGVVPEGHSHTH